MSEQERPEWAADAPLLPGDVHIDPEDDPVAAYANENPPEEHDDSELPDENPGPPEGGEPEADPEYVEPEPIGEVSDRSDEPEVEQEVDA